MYSLAAEETAKHRAKFGWPPVSDVAAVTSQDAKPVETCWGAPKFPNRSKPGRSPPYSEACGGDIAA